MESLLQNIQSSGVSVSSHYRFFNYYNIGINAFLIETQVLTAASMKMAAFWVSLVDVYRRDE
jgi:hypothetical protein